MCVQCECTQCVCVCVRVCVCVCARARVCVIMRRRLLMLCWLFHQDCCAVAIHPDHAAGKRVLLLSSVSASQNFHRMLHFFVASL